MVAREIMLKFVCFHSFFLPKQCPPVCSCLVPKCLEIELQLEKQPFKFTCELSTSNKNPTKYKNILYNDTNATLQSLIPYLFLSLSFNQTFTLPYKIHLHCILLVCV